MAEALCCAWRCQVSNMEPCNHAMTSFLKWCLVDKQNFLGFNHAIKTNKCLWSVTKPGQKRSIWMPGKVETNLSNTAPVTTPTQHLLHWMVLLTTTCGHGMLHRLEPYLHSDLLSEARIVQLEQTRICGIKAPFIQHTWMKHAKKTLLRIIELKPEVSIFPPSSTCSMETSLKLPNLVT